VVIIASVVVLLTVVVFKVEGTSVDVNNVVVVIGKADVLVDVTLNVGKVDSSVNICSVDGSIVVLDMIVVFSVLRGSMLVVLGSDVDCVVLVVKIDVRWVEVGGGGGIVLVDVGKIVACVVVVVVVVISSNKS
jgi:hypothetical protein